MNELIYSCFLLTSAALVLTMAFAFASQQATLLDEYAPRLSQFLKVLKYRQRQVVIERNSKRPELGAGIYYVRLQYVNG